MTPEVLFTVEEVNELIPRLEALVAKLHANARGLQEERDALGRSVAGEPPVSDVIRQRPGARVHVESIEAAANAIAELGGHLKDLSLGLVDFPAEHEGERVLLCWQYGEPEVAFWHRADEGFAGRRPLPGSRQAPHLQ